MSLGSSIPDLMQVIGESGGVEAGDAISIYFDPKTGITYSFDEIGLVYKIVLESKVFVLSRSGN